MRPDSPEQIRPAIAPLPAPPAVVPPQLSAAAQDWGLFESSAGTAQRHWSLTRSFWGVMALTVGIYFLRVGLLPVFGEEPRRGVIAREMLETGDWIVPRVQGVPRLSRPPLQNWLIALASRLTGSVDVWAIRLPSLLATLGIVVVLYGYAFHRAGQTAAALAAVAYVTMYEVMEYGRLGETEAVFTFFVAASLLLWHWGDAGRWNPWITWSVCYLLAAGGMLTKGLQAPLYFAGGVGVYLLLTGRLRKLFTLPHVFGISVLLTTVGAWQLAFVRRMDWHSGLLIYSLNVANRFTDKTHDSFLAHLFIFPLEVAAVMLPGALLLLPVLSPLVRSRLAGQRDLVRFLLISICWAFVFVWLPPGGRARYFMPLMPLWAVLMGLVGAAWIASPTMIAAQAVRRRIAFGGGLAAAAIYVGPMMSIQARSCGDISGQVAALKEKLPSGTELMSFDQLHHGFLYYYDRPIPIVPVPVSAEEVPPGLEYFAIHTHDADPPPLPFAWEEIDVIACDRYRRSTPRVRIHIGRKIAANVDVASRNDGRGGSQID